MAKKAKGVRMIVTLECTEQRGSGIPGMSRYTTYKNKRNTPAKLELMKYNKFMRKHTTIARSSRTSPDVSKTPGFGGLF